MIALAFDDVGRTFVTPTGAGYCAIQHVQLEIPAGAFVAVVGPSGCGKSTLLHIAAGLLTPTVGAVRVDGAPLVGLNGRATYMFQQDALLPWKNVRDNVALGLVLLGASTHDAHTRADEWLERVGLSLFADHYPSQLSGGMRKRTAMAQNWILDRSTVLMDEPFAALDIHTRQRMGEELLQLWDDRRQPGTARKTVLLVTHDLEEAIALADHVVVLSAGPASHVVAQFPVTLDRPRDLLELRTSSAFVDLYRAMWSVLRQEVVKSRASEAQSA